MKYLRLFEKAESIQEICKRYNIRDYSINDDGSIDVNGNINFSFKDLLELPLKFRNVTGDFDCSYNKLKSLEGVPKLVGGTFRCASNELETLEGSPKSIGLHFDCSYNKLETLELGPLSVGRQYYCIHNRIVNLKGLSEVIFSDFDCSFNPIYNIWKLFKDQSLIEYFNSFDCIRGNNIIIDRLNLFLEDIGEDTVQFVKGYNNI